MDCPMTIKKRKNYGSLYFNSNDGRKAKKYGNPHCWSLKTFCAIFFQIGLK